MNRLTGAALALAIVLGILPGRGVAQISPNPEQQEQEITQAVESRYGPKYYVDYFVDVDYAQQLPQEQDRFFDPKGTLQNAIVFSAQKSSQVVVGVYQNGSIRWSDQWERKWCVSATGFLRTQDLNDDGNVELVYTGDGCHHNGVTRLWIYSWDGQQGDLLNAGRTSLLTDVRSTAEFADLTGDGILEIVGWRQVSQKPVFENGEMVAKEPIMERVAYSWNGQEYGQWPSTPEVPDDRGKLAQSVSRDLMTIRVDASARPVSPDTLRYRYDVENDASSHQPLEDIHVAADSATSLQQPEDWISIGNLTYAETRFARWVENGPPPRPYIRPGERGVVSYASPGLPSIEPMYFQGHVEFVYSGTGGAGLEYITENSVSVQTIVARYPPDSTEYQGYLDTLRTYPERARQQGWITTDAAANKYETRLDSAYDHLAAADSFLAQQALSEVAAQAEADSGDVLTSEGYALLYYNAGYLAERLPARPPE